MTSRSLFLLAVAVGGFVGWIGGALAYVNWFSETGRAGADVLMVAFWVSAGIGVAATAAFGLSVRGAQRG